MNDLPSCTVEAFMTRFWKLLVLSPGVAGVLAQAGCGDASFSVSVGIRDAGDGGDPGNEDAGTVGVVLDAGASDAADSAPPVCEPYSCKPGCGDCNKDAGLSCGNGGIFTCGSTDCTVWSTGTDAGFTCANPAISVLYGCVGTVTDIMPRCIYMGSSNRRWYCCS
jgi:hypothetical protein